MYSFAYVPEYLVLPAVFCTFITFETWIHSLITNNVSQVDRLWVILPTIYSAYFALLPLWPRKNLLWLTPYVQEELHYVAADFSPRAVLMLALIVIWMFRLGYNTWRRGLFRLDEDYRWDVLRQSISPFLFQVINFVFVSVIQNILLFTLSLPTYTAAILQPHTPLANSDYLLAFTAIVTLFIEFTADNQQYAFHSYKHAYNAQRTDKNSPKYDPRQHWFGSRLNWQPEDADRGFCTKGLWAFSRHPNFACEQTFWIIITAFPIFANFPSIGFEGRNLQVHLGSFGYQILPAAALCLLFWASTIFTESITASKYEAYKAYQKRVAMFNPVSTLLLRMMQSLIFGEDGRALDRLIWNSEKTE